MDLCHSPVTSLEVNFSCQLHPPPAGDRRPPNQGLPLSDQGNQICCSCSVREQALPETREAAGERFLPARGCKYLYNVGAWEEGRQREVAGTRRC